MIARLNAAAELLTFADTNTLDGIATITDRHPSVIVIEGFLTATSRGAAPIKRITDDATLAGVEIRVLAHDTDHARTITTAPAAPVGAAPGGAVLDYHGTRRAMRFKLRDGVGIKVDGDSATVIDMSRIGAQVVLGSALRPYQRVRVSLQTADAAVRCRGGHRVVSIRTASRQRRWRLLSGWDRVLRRRGRNRVVLRREHRSSRTGPTRLPGRRARELVTCLASEWRGSLRARWYPRGLSPSTQY